MIVPFSWLLYDDLMHKLYLKCWCRVNSLPLDLVCLINTINYVYIGITKLSHINCNNFLCRLRILLKGFMNCRGRVLIVSKLMEYHHLS